MGSKSIISIGLLVIGLSSLLASASDANTEKLCSQLSHRGIELTETLKDFDGILLADRSVAQNIADEIALTEIEVDALQLELNACLDKYPVGEECATAKSNYRGYMYIYQQMGVEYDKQAARVNRMYKQRELVLFMQGRYAEQFDKVCVNGDTK